MTIEEAKEFVRIHALTGKTIHASTDGGIYIDADVPMLQSLGVVLFQVFPEAKQETIPEILPEPQDKKFKKSE